MQIFVTVTDNRAEQKITEVNFPCIFSIDISKHCSARSCTPICIQSAPQKHILSLHTVYIFFMDIINGILLLESYSFALFM